MKIAAFLPNWIGDAVMATPALQALRRLYPKAHLLGVMKPYVAGVLEGCPWFDEAHLVRNQTWSGSTLGTALKLKREKYDLAVLFLNTLRPALTTWLAGCRRRVGYDRYRRGFLLTDKLQPICDDAGRPKPTPVIDSYNRLIEQLGSPPPGRQMHLWTTDEDEEQADLLWRATRLRKFREVVCLNPGGAFGAAKHWPVEHFAKLAHRLATERNGGVLILCGPAEREMAAEIQSQANHPNVHSLANVSLSLGLSKACVRRCSLLITTDSGPRHFAGAFGRPVITLFGPTHIEWTETYLPHAFHLQKQMNCGPCQKRVCPLRHHRCMKELLPDDVFASAEQLLKQVERRASA